MPANQGSKKRYPPELKERAARMVLETIEENGGTGS
jgi:transposase-like protein